MKQDPAADYKCRDKFLVQAVPITGDKEFVSVQDIVCFPGARQARELCLELATFI